MLEFHLSRNIVFSPILSPIESATFFNRIAVLE